MMIIVPVLFWTSWLGLFYNVLDISLVIPISTAQFIVVMLRSCTRSPARAFTLIGLDLWAMEIGSGETLKRPVVEKCHFKKYRDTHCCFLLNIILIHKIVIEALFFI